MTDRKLVGLGVGDDAADLQRRVDKLVQIAGGRRVLTAADEPDPAKRLGAVVLSDVVPTPPKPLLLDRLDPEGHTILYGTGGTGKGTIACYWIGRLVALGHTVLVVDYENHRDEWARRIHGLSGADVAQSVVWVGPATADWKGEQGALWEQADELRELAQAVGATYVVVDSIIPACGGTDPMKPEAAGQYARGLELVGLPTLSLAHVTKADESAYPFGSVFWHNLARCTWNVVKQSGDGHRVLLSHKKHNNYEKQARAVLTMTYRDNVPVDVLEKSYTVVLSDLIADALGDDALSVPELMQRLNDDVDDPKDRAKDDSVRAALRRGITSTPKLFTKDGDRWKRA